MSADESRFLNLLHPPAALPAQPHRLLTGGALVCGALSLVLIAGDLGLRGFALGFVLAAVPVPIYVFLALWLDRFEPEPPRTLLQTFAWGATVAVFVALMVNMMSQDMMASVAGERAAELFGGLVTAPVVEELAKGFALLILFRELKDEFDGVVDGVVYAAMVGLGFAMVENVEYYGRAVTEGGDSSMVTFFLRGMLSPFAHPLFTSMFGIGLGIVRERHGEAKSWAAPVLGLSAAVALHALWNLSATFEGWFYSLYLMVMLPVFIGVLVLIYASLRRESRVLRHHLSPLVGDGVLSEAELECLCGVRARLGASMEAWRRGGVERWRLRRELHQVASELAFHRWRVLRGLTLGPEADARREAEYLRRLRELCEHAKSA
ncbi:MAG TPA: PrsW family intramembrane metalloprotease [Longimicrobium sp.]|nr:PrsW family intramembrane metalloprotease [Longimicrobium sp.]